MIEYFIYTCGDTFYKAYSFLEGAYTITIEVEQGRNDRETGSQGHG